MPNVKTDDGASIYVEVEGPENAPVLMLSNSLGTNLHCGTTRRRPGAAISAWCVTTGAVTANRACRRDLILWSALAATCWR
jgi:hypothetical protein